MTQKFLIAGLGNPGDKFENSRHNVGFIAADMLAQKFVLQNNYSNKFDANFITFTYNDKKIFLIKPQTYMNRSGLSLAKFVNFYQIPINNVFIFYDDIDINLGKIKVKIAGGSGGHNGIKSIDENIGKNYVRVRIGIKPDYEINKVDKFVLSKFTSSELNIIKELIIDIIKEIDFLLAHKFDNFVSNILSNK